MMNKIIVYQDNRNEWRWKLIAKNGRTIAVSSEGYINLEDCHHAINLILNLKTNNNPVNFKRKNLEIITEK